MTHCLQNTIENLPAYGIADRVNELLKQSSRLVITAPPGAGKSTLLPITISKQYRHIILLEPRRIAARQVAERMAELLSEDVGETVGYRIRFESRVSSRTRIEVVTEGILTRMLIDDPTLDGIDAVIFDEYHERSIHSDVALALTCEAQRLLRDDLRIVLMSATIDATTICQALDAPLIQSEGRMYDVDIRYCGEDNRPIWEQTAHIVRQAHREQEGDILVFLPGQSEILRTAELLEGALGDTAIYPLYGQLSIEEQRRAILPDGSGRRRVVLATNIAETSLTIEGVRVVVDSGLCRTLVYDQRSGLSHLETVRISRDMATQRSGRAGRLAPGTCYRLWTYATETRMRENRLPEIQEADLTSMVLDIAAWQGSISAQQIVALPWITPPPAAKVQQAIELIAELGALDEEGKLSRHGRALSALPCHPRIANMLLYADTDEQKAIACEVAAELEDGTRNRRIADAYRHLIHTLSPATQPTPYERGRYIALAYPERIMRQGNGWIAVAAMDAKTGTIHQSAPVHIEELSCLMHTHRSIRWDSKQGCVVAETQRRIAGTVIDSRPIADITTAEVTRLIAAEAPKQGLSLFDFSDAVTNLQQRIATAGVWHSELALPDVSTDVILRQAHEWLPLYIGNARSINELKKIDLCAVVWGMLSYEQQCAVDRIAPSHITVPTGSRIRIEYRVGSDLPVLRVRLQECFGMTDTPRIDDGRQAVLMELLSPGYKPVQLTQDLHSFWTGTYYEVRKELRRRYPKHYWPDNPLEAEPTRTTKRPNY